MTSYRRRLALNTAWRFFAASIAALIQTTLFAQTEPPASPLPEALTTGRISAQFRGAGIDQVRMHVALLHGSAEFELVVPAGLVLAPADQKSQPVITCMTVFYRVTKKNEASTIATDPIVPVCLLKLEGRAPMGDPLSIKPQENSELSAVLRIVDKYLAGPPLGQAAVWITATDAWLQPLCSWILPRSTARSAGYGRNRSTSVNWRFTLRCQTSWPVGRRSQG